MEHESAGVLRVPDRIPHHKSRLFSAPGLGIAQVSHHHLCCCPGTASPARPEPGGEEGASPCPALPIHPYAGGDTASAACFILFYSLLCMRGVSALLPCVCPPRSSALVLFQTPSEKGCALQFATKRARQAAELNRSELKQPAKPGEQSILVPRSMARAHSLMRGWKSVRSAIDRSLHGQGEEWRRVGTWSREGRKKV